MTMIAFLPPSSRWTCLSRSAAAFVTATPGLARAGEGDHRHVGVADERLARLLAVAVHDVDDARRHARLGEQLDEALGEQRRVLGRLEHDRVAADERRAELPGRDRDREVPRRDRADDADRHAHAHHELVAAARSASSGRTGAGPRRPCSSSCRSLPGRRRRPRPCTFPISRVIRSVSSALCSRRSSAKRKRIVAALAAPGRAASPRTPPSRRRRRGRRRPRPSAGTMPSTSPVAGTSDSNVSPPAASTHSPPMKFSKLGAGDGHAAILAPDQAPVDRSPANVPGTRARRRSRDSRSLGELAAPLAAPAVGPLAAVDDHRHVRVVGVVRDELVVQLGLELARDDAVDHGSVVRPASETRDVRDDPAVLDEVRVPLGERALELVGLVPALGEPHRLRRVGRDAVLVPGDLPGDRDDDSGLTPESGDDRDAAASPRLFAIPPTVRRYCEALKRSAASTIASSRLGEPAQDRLARDRRLGRRSRAPRSAASENRLRRRSAGIVGVVGEPSFTQPYSSADLLAERADVDVVLAAVRREAHRALAHQQRALADRALRSVLTRVTRIARG